MDLEVKIYSIYLPYSLKVQYDLNGDGKFFRVGTLTGIRNQFGNELIVGFNRYGYFPECCKPILKPMSKLIEDKKLIDELDKISFGTFSELYDIKNINKIPNILYQILVENHYDVFGLIEKGLAIDINTL